MVGSFFAFFEEGATTAAGSDLLPTFLGDFLGEGTTALGSAAAFLAGSGLASFLAAGFLPKNDRMSGILVDSGEHSF